jgi:hypothetical protein
MPIRMDPHWFGCLDPDPDLEVKSWIRIHNTEKYLAGQADDDRIWQVNTGQHNIVIHVTVWLHLRYQTHSWYIIAYARRQKGRDMRLIKAENCALLLRQKAVHDWQEAGHEEGNSFA